jgi:hyperosmotically inducible protein
MMISQRTLAIAIASLSLVAAGCDRPDTSDTARSDGTLQKSPSDYTSPQKSASSSDAALKRGSGEMPSTGTPESTTQPMGQSGTTAASKTGDAVDKAVDKAVTAIDDATLTAKVKAALIAEPGLKTTQIKVETQDGVVTLAGNVESQSMSERAIQLATGTTGVRQVVDRLVVKSS